jgi:hypothetical protein
VRVRRVTLRRLDARGEALDGRRREEVAQRHLDPEDLPHAREHLRR